MTPEEIARQEIDAQLAASGWIVQDYTAADFSTGRGIVLREVLLTTGPCDYLLLVDRRAVGVIEAKKIGATLSTVAEQSGRYASNLPEFLAAGLTGPLPFLYESTGVETFFRDERDPAPRSRRVFTFHRPETLAEWAAEPDTLRARLQKMPAAQPLEKNGNGDSPMRDCQVEAIHGLEKSFAEDRPRALIHMATGAGKTYTACAFTYRLIKYAKARRVLFLVDRSNLGEQARDEFHRFRTPDTGRLFTELYNVQHLTSPHIDDVCRVTICTICTIQRLYSILRGEELAEGADDLSGVELAHAISSGDSSGRESAPSLLPASISQSRLTSGADSPLPGGEGKGEGERKHSRSAVHRFADLVALVRFALEQQPVLEPFAAFVTTRFNEWLSSRGVPPLSRGEPGGSGVSPLNPVQNQSRDGSATFTPEQLSWLYLIRDHIATRLRQSILHRAFTGELT